MVDVNFLLPDLGDKAYQTKSFPFQNKSLVGKNWCINLFSLHGLKIAMDETDNRTYLSSILLIKMKSPLSVYLSIFIFTHHTDNSFVCVAINRNQTYSK